MSLKETWVDKQNNVDKIMAEDVNSIANGVIQCEEDIKKIEKNKLDSSELTSAVNSALEQAKESGDFKGDRGEPGANGESITISNVELISNGTKVTFSDGNYIEIMNGEDGIDGKNGNGIKSAVLNADYTLTLTFDDGTKYTTPSIRGAAGKDGSNGKNGADGVGVASIKQTTTSTVDGGNNVFTVTLTNGTSATFTVKNGSKGSKGDTGAQGLRGDTGEKGDPGENGYTPVKGVDYYTEADKSEFSEYIASELAKRGQLSPEYANSIEECTDTSKMYVLPDGFIYAYMLTEVETGPSYTNLLPKAINADGTPYVGTNGEKGYKTGYRVSSSGTEKTATGYECTGYIPAAIGQTVRIKNISDLSTKDTNGYCTVYFFQDGFVKATPSLILKTQATYADGTYTFTVPTNATPIMYFRTSLMGASKNTIITVNEEIVEGGGTTITYAWANTGHAFVPADYEERIVDLETDTSNLKLRVSNLEADTGGGGTVATDSVEILLPSEAVAVVGVEFNIYYKSIIRASRPVDGYDVKCYLSNNSVTCRRYAECFRMTADADDVGDYTLTVEVRNLKDYAVVASKSMTLHIIANTAVTGKNVLFIGDSLTFSRAGLYAAEIQHNLSNGGITSMGTQNGSVDINQVGNVKHEGYNGATIGGFLKANVTSAFTNPFYNPTSGTFDLAYFMTNNGYSKVDAVCLNLGHNNLGNEVAGVNDLKTIIQKIHAYNADIPVIISLITPLGGQDSHSHLGFSAGQMRYHWRQLIKAYITAFDNGKISNVYLSTPYFNVDQDNDLPTETVTRCARDTTQIVRQNDSMHPTRIGTLKMAESYYATLLYHIAD